MKQVDITIAAIRKIYKPRFPKANKGDFGKACIVAGSYGKIGAAVLSTSAALRTGSGLTFCAAPECGYTVLQTACPEAMFIKTGQKQLENFIADDEYTYGVGPGIGTAQTTAKWLFSFLKKQKNPLVLDADALNILSERPENFKNIPKNSIITPHPKKVRKAFRKNEISFRNAPSRP